MGKKLKSTSTTSAKLFLYARKCSQCGCGMDEGYYYDDSLYFCGDNCLTGYLYKEEISYYTSWDVESNTLVGEKAYDDIGKSHVYRGE